MDPAPTIKFSAAFALPVSEELAPDEVKALTDPPDVALESEEMAEAETLGAEAGAEAAVVVWPYAEALLQFWILTVCAAL